MKVLNLIFSIYDLCTKRCPASVATSPAIPIRRIGLANGPYRLFSKKFRERPRSLVKLTRSPRHGRHPAPRSRTSAASSRIAAARRISPLSGGRSFLPAAVCSSPLTARARRAPIPPLAPAAAEEPQLARMRVDLGGCGQISLSLSHVPSLLLLPVRTRPRRRRDRITV